MYANADNLASLPRVLDGNPGAGPRRRRGIAGHRFDAGRLDRFNRLLARFGRPVPLDCDQIATAARAVVATAGGAAPCIVQRLERAGAMARMLGDRNWAAGTGAEPVAQAVVAYVLEHDDLLPDWVPGAGRLDDAIVVEAAWPMVSAEVLDYLDFCRLRQLEASLRGIDAGALGYGRADWEESRRAEAALKAHRRDVFASGYVPAAAVLFRVH